MALLTGVFSGNVAAAMIDETAFTERVAARLQALQPELRIESVRPLEIHFGNEAEPGAHVAYLHNAYQAYRNGEALAGVVETYARASVKTLEAVAPDLGNIVPIIKDAAYVNEVSATLKADEGSAPDQALYATPYSEGLVILYAVDTPENIQYLSHRDFQALAMPEPALRARAIENLNRMLPQLTLHSGDDRYMFTAGGNYESSLLLLDAVWDRLAKRMKGGMVVGIPSRDVLLIADSANQAAVAGLRDKVREIHASGNYTLTPELYERVDGGWRRLAGQSPAPQ